MLRINSANAKNGTVKPIMITITDDQNEWKSNNGGIIFFQVFVGFISFTFLILGIRSQIMFSIYQGIKPTAAQICLLFDNLALISIFIHIIDFWSVHKFYLYQLILASMLLMVIFVLISSLSLYSLF
eukprot:TRINITY_DN5718_c0_g1_i3.p1 TRINITY_DN5718_c0_g1~~TRINITY_DN5718_c0_g1_i3.p1  ORF type:complete len:127 (-),score=3.91 TRINITY_DN5718_c0_g1_i3:130-510(-)